MAIQPNPSGSQDFMKSQFDEENIDIKRYLSLFLSNWYWFAIALFVSISIAYGINRWSEDVFRVSSTILIKADQSPGISELFPNGNIYKSQQNLNNEMGILKSFNLNYKVMKELPDFYVDYIAVGKRGIAETRLYKGSPFFVVYDSINKQSFNQKVDIKILSDQSYRLEINGGRNYSKELTFGERFNEMGFDFSIVLRNKDEYIFNPEASNQFYFLFNNPYNLANLYRSKLSIAPIEADASFVSLTTSGFVPAQEIDYLNKLMDVYLEFGLEFKNVTAAQTIDFIETQLSTISDSLRIAEDDIENFRLTNKFMNISQEGTSIQNRLERIDEERTTLILQKNYYEYLKTYIESKKDNVDIVSPTIIGITDQLLISYVEELAGLQQKLRLIEMNLYNSTEPLNILLTDISVVKEAILQNVTDGLKSINKTISDVDRRIIETEQEIRRLPSAERYMIRIQRKFDINNSVYTFLLEKRAEAGITKASNVPDNRIIDYASSFSSSKIAPKGKQNLMIAFVLGLFLPLLGIVGLDYLNNKIMDKKDIEKGTSAPLIGFISHNDSKIEMPVVEKPGSILSESFRSVRTNLKYFVKDIECPVISVSSTITGEGKTFISINLASIIALSGKKVLLVGLDMRKPRIHKVFSISNKTGMSNYLIGQETFEEVITKTEIQNLWYANSGPVPPNPAELIETDRMKEFIERAKGQFDYIIIDTPPVAIVTDALLASPFTDFYLFVVRQRYTSKNTLGLIEELLKNENIKSLGVLINDINLSGYYGYGLRYGYSLGYGYSYGYNYYGNYSDRKYGYSDSSKSYYEEG